MRCANLYTLLLAIAFTQTTSVPAQRVTPPEAFQPVNGHDTKQPPASAVTNDWYAAAVQTIQQQAIQFRPQLQRGCYTAAGPHQHTGFFIAPNGYTVHGVQQPAWQVAFHLRGIGRGQLQWQPGNDYSVVQHNNELCYQYKQVQVQYINNNEGLRQNFIVARSLPGSGALTVTIEPETRLTPGMPAANKLAFYANNKQVLSYEDLQVWDAHHTPLPASMQLQNGLVTITVNDENASYPITIDPINKTPEWTTSADGLLTGLATTQINSALYGYTVASVGDVNGDGYGDAAISAPALASIFSGNGSLLSVGAVFVFYGSPAGLHTTPDKTLQPSTAAAGALFGFSIDAGDVNGDGFSDIIIGAPMDSYQTTAAGLLGAVSATVQAGKVYIYPGGTSAAANPTNFLEVKLQGTGFFSTGVAGLLGSNVHAKPLFGFSVAATNDLNGDGKADIIVGAPAYLGTGLTDVQNGAAFVYYSNNLGTTTPVTLQTPSAALLGLVSFPSLTQSGLLYGFSVDGIGDYNNDGFADVVVGAPAGIDLSSLSGIFTGQVLGGSAYVYYGNGSGINSTIGASLQPTAGGLLGNAANLFGFKVKGLKNADGIRNGGIAIGAPLGGLIPGTLGLTVKTGSVYVFKKKASAPAGTVTSDQTIESPRAASLLQILNTLQLNVLFGASIDNAYDINCDGFADMVVGEPLSSGTNLSQLQANAVGGAAYVFTGNGTGGFVPAANYTVSTSYGNQLLSVNAVSLFGYSVTTVPNVLGIGSSPRIIAGAPAGALDFGSGLLNLGSTVSTLFNFAAGDNGPGKAFLFNPGVCAITLPVTLVEFRGTEKNSDITLQWKTGVEEDLNYYELERSNNGSDYTGIAMVFPWEDKSRTDYAYLDKNVPAGTNYYRLKMIDKNGTYTYSRILTFSPGGITGLSIAVMPNPVTDIIHIQFNNAGNGMYRVELRNALGQLFVQKTVQVTQNRQTESLMRTVGMTPGVYFLHFFEKNTNKVSSYKLLVR